MAFYAYFRHINCTSFNLGTLPETINGMKSLSRKIIRVCLFSFLTFFVTQCGIGGSGIPGGNDIGIEIVDGEIAVDPVYVRTGINSSTVIDGNLKATTYVGRTFFKEVNAEESDTVLSFNPSLNFLTLDE